jgi:hypothetical protein
MSHKSTYIIFAFLILVNSCKKDETYVNINLKKKFYIIKNKENHLLSFNYRLYYLNKDTLNEKCTTISLNGNINGTYTNKYLVRNQKIYILLNVDDLLTKTLYFSTEKLDTCYNINKKFDQFKICYKGLYSDNKYKNMYNINYEETTYDGDAQNIILDKDFTLIYRSSLKTNKKETLVDSILVPIKIRNIANNIKF